MPVLAALVVASTLTLAAAPAAAQGGANALPGLSALPKAPADTRLPGPDPRQCGTSQYAALCAMGRWSQFARIEVTLTAGPFSGTYTMERPDNGETLTTYRERSPAGRRGGEVLLINDTTFAYRTRETVPTDDDALDYLLAAPNMAAQLVAVLLDQAVLGGPRDVTAPMTISAGSATQYVRTETPTRAALYGPPWRVTGSVRPAADGALAFALKFAFHPVDKAGRRDARRSETLDLAGVVSFANRRRAMPESLDLVGWKLVRNGSELPAVSTLAEARTSAGP